MTRSDMLLLLRTDVVNEQTHMMYYLMNAASVQGLHRAHLQAFLAGEAESEMGHVRAFTDQLVALEGPVALSGLSPLPISVRTDPQDILQGAIALEEEVVRNYDLRISQCEELHAAEEDSVAKAFWRNLGLFYEEQLEHSHNDLNNLRQMFAAI